MTEDRRVVEELALWVGHYGLGAVFPRVAAWLGVPSDWLEGGGPSTRRVLDCPARGVRLELEYVLKETRRRPADGWALREIFVTPPEGDAPFGLSARTETPESARVKLSDDVVGGRTADFQEGDLRITHFLDDGRAVEVRFLPGMVGFDRVWIVRMGAAMDLRAEESKDGSVGASEGAAEDVR